MILSDFLKALSKRSGGFGVMKQVAFRLRRTYNNGKEVE